MTATTSPEGSDDEVPADGRLARAVRTRRAIVDALLSLLEEGDLQPTANRIAERAGTSLRLIYHHFGDLESLYQAAARRQAERVVSMSTPIPSELPLDERIARLVEQRTDTLEWFTPVRRASLLQEPFSAELQAARQAFYALGEERVAAVLAPELDALAPDRGAVTLAAVANLLAWGLWNDLRSTGRSVEEARAAVLLAVRACLGR
jgi:TetR/AcrR family transcriptional regulator of autoinduction and epiphytic fitness